MSMLNDDVICIWADDTWCFGDEVEGYTFMSDDYAVISTEGIEDLDAYVLQYNRSPQPWNS